MASKLKAETRKFFWIVSAGASSNVLRWNPQKEICDRDS
jgi:hypothetical protein